MTSDSRFAIVRSLPEPILLVTVEGRILHANDAACQVLGRSAGDLQERSLQDVTDSPRDEVARYLRSCARTNELVPGAFDVRRPDGEAIRIGCGGRGVPSPSGRDVLIRWVQTETAHAPFVHLNEQIEGLARELKQRKRMEASLRDSEARMRTIVQTAAEGIITFLADGTVESFNLAAEKIFGLPADEVVGGDVRRLLPPGVAEGGPEEALAYLGHAASSAVRDEVRPPLERLARHRDGELFPAEFSLAEVALEGRRLFVCILRDIRERKQLEQRLLHQATHDPLTGIPNRTLLEDRLGQAIASARRRGEMVALLFIDLDRFKVINDSLGHELGDRVLCELARRLEEECRACDTVARLGGDEFVWLITRISSEEEAFRPAQRVRERASESFHVDGRDLVVSASIGISVFPRDGDDVATLLSRADAAMYAAKTGGRDTYRAYSTQIGQDASYRLEMETRLRKAIHNGELRLFYQPQISIHDGFVRGVEALVRWEDGENGLIAPGDFIPVAEESGLIVPLGAWVIEEACRQAARWQEAGLDGLRMAINVSPRQFEQSNLRERIVDILDRTGLDARCIDLELTEGSVMKDVAKNTARLEDLKDLGLEISIDDFGTGHSSLAYLQRFPIDAIKIDRSFVNDIDSSEGDLTLVRAIIGLAHNLGLRVIAEGVETPEQLSILQQEGCDEAQGYLVSRPLPADAIEALLFMLAAED